MHYKPSSGIFYHKLPELTRGGRAVNLKEHGGTLYAQLDYAEGEIYALKDLNGKGLLNPIERKREIRAAIQRT